MTDDLVERLSRGVPYHNPLGGYLDHPNVSAADALMAEAAARINSDADTIASLRREREAAAPPHQYDHHWKVVAELDPDGKEVWHPVVWGKHQALHVTNVRQAIAIGLQRAPECADVIACLIWNAALSQNRHDFLMADKEERLTTLEAQVAKLTEALEIIETANSGKYTLSDIGTDAVFLALNEAVKVARAALQKDKT